MALDRLNGTISFEVNPDEALEGIHADIKRLIEAGVTPEGIANFIAQQGTFQAAYAVAYVYHSAHVGLYNINQWLRVLVAEGCERAKEAN